MDLYIYDGPVTEFGKCIVNNWHGATQAVSMSKAKSNLLYQFKVKNDRLPNAKIDLPGVIRKEE